MALALSEQTLAKILIAGSGLSVKTQCKLLRTLANAVDPAPPAAPVRPRTSAAKRRAAGRVRWRARIIGLDLNELFRVGRWALAIGVAVPRSPSSSARPWWSGLRRSLSLG